MVPVNLRRQVMCHQITIMVAHQRKRAGRLMELVVARRMELMVAHRMRPEVARRMELEVARLTHLVAGRPGTLWVACRPSPGLCH